MITHRWTTSDDVLVRGDNNGERKPLSEWLSNTPFLHRVRAVSTQHIPISWVTDPPNGKLMVDDVTVESGEEVLLANQETESDNGVVEVGSTAGPWLEHRTLMTGWANRQCKRSPHPPAVASDGTQNARQLFVGLPGGKIIRTGGNATAGEGGSNTQLLSEISSQFNNAVGLVPSGSRSA